MLYCVFCVGYQISGSVWSVSTSIVNTTQHVSNGFDNPKGPVFLKAKSTLDFMSARISRKLEKIILKVVFMFHYMPEVFPYSIKI